MHDPVEIFKAHWSIAKSSGDPNASYCSLATVSEDGQASIRTLVLREVTDEAFTLFISDTSRKWQELQASKKCELLVFWPTLMQQYRVRGDLHEVDAETMKTHWAKKPYASKILDHYYADVQPQTSVVESRAALVSEIEVLKARYPREEDVPFPDNAKGVAIKASYMEVWHGSASDRLHERSLYVLSGSEWEKTILVP